MYIAIPYVCHLQTYGYMPVWRYGGMAIWPYGCMPVCLPVCLHVCLHLYLHISTCMHAQGTWTLKIRKIDHAGVSAEASQTARAAQSKIEAGRCCFNSFIFVDCSFCFCCLFFQGNHEKRRHDCPESYDFFQLGRCLSRPQACLRGPSVARELLSTKHNFHSCLFSLFVCLCCLFSKDVCSGLQDT